MKRIVFFFIAVFTSISIRNAMVPDELHVLFLSDGSGESNSGHNGKINHHKLKPSFLRSGIKMTYSSNLEDLNPETLAKYSSIIMYLSAANDKPERVRALIEYVENGGGLVALHNTCGAFDGTDEFVKLIGGQFDRHESGWFTATHVKGQENHPALGGVPEFEVWDENYVHKNLNDDRTDLLVRNENGFPEPWTWVRNQGKGKIFYTAYGHDGNVWESFFFQKMVTAATIWTSNKTPRINSDIPILTYLEDKKKLFHNFEQRQTSQMIQNQLSPEESAKCMILPEGFEAQLFSNEPDIVNPIDMTWDDQGRMYVAVTIDYPYIQENGNDRIVICEDTDSDGQADKFTTFAEGFSLVTGMCWVNGGIILAQAPNMYFLKDTDGDDKADVIKQVNTGWGIGDTHGGPSNLKYGLDNKIYGCVGGGGYTDDRGRFSAGIWRMDVDGSNITRISNLGDNSWGLGISEDFELFASSANKGPAKHIHAPYPYFDAVGLKKQHALPIFDYHTFYPVTITRQGDNFGSYTAAAGFDIYTARTFPQKFWNKTAFIGAPTGKLLGQFHLEPDNNGSYRAINGGSFLASFDERTAPIQGKTGPDGNLYMLDWNNLIMLHGGELDNPLRDKSHGRIYRITYKGGKSSRLLNLKNATTNELVDNLKNENMFWRIMAQKKIIQGKHMDAIPQLIEMAQDPSLDGIRSNPAVIHALWTLHGLEQMDGTNKKALSVAHAALEHRSAAVRKNAVRVLPATLESTRLLGNMLDEQDANTLRYILLTLSIMPKDDALDQRIYNIGQQIKGKNGLESPYHLALIRHGSTLVEKLITDTPERNREMEGVVDKLETELINVLQNPSFEEFNDEKPAQWVSKVHKGEATLSIDSTISRTGKYSGRIESSVGGGAEFHMVPRLEPGEYLLSGWIKTKNVEGRNGVLLKAEGSGMKAKESRRLQGTHEDWQKLQMTFKVDFDSGVLIYCLFGAWAEAKGTVWFDDIELFQLSSEKVIPKVIKVESLLAKQAFEKGADAIIRITELINKRQEESSSIFMEGLTELEDILFTDSQVHMLKNLAADAAPANKMSLAIFGSNNNIDLGLSELANSLKGFEVKILEGDKTRGKMYTTSCVVCHGSDFTGLLSERTPSLPQLSDWYLQGQLQKFKHNVLGYDVEDSDGYAMKTLMGKYSHQQIADMVAYIKTFQPKPQSITLGGNPITGKEVYSDYCLACHQADGTGNKTINAPGLVGLSDVYTYHQLVKYKNGIRGSGTGDKHGKVMQLFAKILENEQTMKDIGAYITTLQNKGND